MGNDNFGTFFIEGLSSSRRVLYQRFHRIIIYYLSITNFFPDEFLAHELSSLEHVWYVVEWAGFTR